MEFDKTPRFWYPRVALDVWINFSSRTVGVSRKSPFLFFSPHSLYFYSISFLSSPCLLPFLFFSFLFFLSYPLSILPFVCSHLIFSFLFFLLFHFFSFLSFSPFTSLFLILFHRIFLSFIFSSISFSSFSFFYFSFGLYQSNGPKVGETSPHFPPLPLVITTIFLLIS